MSEVVGMAQFMQIVSANKRRVSLKAKATIPLLSMTEEILTEHTPTTPSKTPRTIERIGRKIVAKKGA